MICVFVAGVVSTLAGGGGSTLSGYVDGIGLFYSPVDVAVTFIGDVIVADYNNNLLRKIFSTGKRCQSVCQYNCFF